MRNRVVALGIVLAGASLALAAAAPLLRGVAVPSENPDDVKEWAGGCSLYCAIAPSVRASSRLAPSGGARYDAKQGHDFNLQTAWVEGAKGNGVGEYLEYTYDFTEKSQASLAVNHITVFNGYRKSRHLWKANGRVKAFALSVNGKPRGVIRLADAYNYQTVELPPIPLANGKKTVLRFTIRDVYPGEKYQDTAVTDLTFDGTGHH